MTMAEKFLRDNLARILDWNEAHVDWKSALTGLPAKHRGSKPPGVAHSAWELLEHARIAQRDILEFCRNPKYVSPDFPSGYWPKNPVPPNAAAWDKSVKAFEQDLHDMQKLAMDPKTDLAAPIPHGAGQTVLREILLLADHNSYHFGQIVLLRQLLGVWSKK